MKRDTHLRREEDHPDDSRVDRLTRQVIWNWVTPKWEKHIASILEREGDVDAVVVFTVPMSHLRGIPSKLSARYGVPFVYYDGDVPMSLPEYGGMDTGFNIYHVVMTTPRRRLIDPDVNDLGEAHPGSGSIDMMLDDPPDPGVMLTRHPRQRCDWHLLGVGQHRDLEQQRKAAARARPRHVY